MTTTIQTAPDAIHHPLSPSRWPAFLRCARFESEVDIDDLPANDSEESAPDMTTAKARGRLQHEAAAAMLLDLDAETIRAKVEPLSERERTEVEWAVNRAVEIIESHGYQRHEIQVEQRVTMFAPDGWSVLYFGTMDVRCGPIIIDFKFGEFKSFFGQMVGYALPLLTEWGKGRVLAYLLFARYRRTDQHTIDKDTAETVGFGLLRRLNNPHRTANPCEYCGFCAHKAACHSDTANHVLAKREDWPGDTLKLDVAHVSMLANDPVLLGKARALWKLYLEPWGEAIEYASKTMAEHGNAPAGFKIQAIKAVREVTSAVAAVKALEAAGCPRDALESALETSMSALARAWQSAFGCSEAKAKVKVEEVLLAAKAMEIKPGYNKLVKLPDVLEQIAAAGAKQAQLSP